MTGRRNSHGASLSQLRPLRPLRHATDCHLCVSMRFTASRLSHRVRSRETPHRPHSPQLPTVWVRVRVRKALVILEYRRPLWQVTMRMVHPVWCPLHLLSLSVTKYLCYLHTFGILGLHANFKFDTDTHIGLSSCEPTAQESSSGLSSVLSSI